MQLNTIANCQWATILAVYRDDALVEESKSDQWRPC